MTENVMMFTAYLSRHRRNAVVPERHQSMIFVPDSNSSCFEQVRAAGKCNLSADRFAALLAQSHLLLS